ncbi:FAD-dependent oxidoreductase [Achromobacter aloeverae]
MGVLGCDVLVVGGGAAGIAVTASLLRRRPGLRIVVAEPAEMHYYQPGWTLVGAGVFSMASTGRPMAAVMPRAVQWLRSAAVHFAPERSEVLLENGQLIHYQCLVVATGLALDWDAIPGLRDALGTQGVTSNYAPGMASYTWNLVQSLRGGTAIFTQPPLPIKCAGAPQKAMYLSASHWSRQGRLGDIRIEFHNAGGALFGVKDYVPALMEYIRKYAVQLRLGSRLVAVDAANRTARFEAVGADGQVSEELRSFDMLHACPPQRPVEVVARSPLAAPDGWLEVDPATLQHRRYINIFAAGDIGNMSNAKTAAAARKQAPVVAANVAAVLGGMPLVAAYDGYGSCPLTVEKGKIVLAEFGYGGALKPTFPTWLLDGTRPSRLAWLLKEKLLPAVYWNLMLRGHEWLSAPEKVDREH